MATFTLTIELGNEAMQDATDIGDALHNVAASLHSGESSNIADHQSGVIFDVNGNRVGGWSVTA